MGNSMKKRTKFSLKKAISAIKESLDIIPIPIIVVGGIYSGILTVTEAGVFLLFYVFFIGKFIYKALSLNELKKILIDSALTTALVGSMIATATVFSYLLSVEGFVPWFISITVPFQSKPMAFMLLIVFALFIMGCFVPITAILIIFAPYFPTIQKITNLHHLHFGLSVILALGLGGITPPYGTLLYIVVHIAKTSIIKCIPTLIPYLIIMIATVLLVIFVPQFSLYIPQLLGQ
jgi:C4-dicarboxylate transporter DctM subunit